MVALRENPYPIYTGHGIFARVPAWLSHAGVGKDAVIISHPLVERLHGAGLTAVLKGKGYSVKVFNVPEGEASKSAVHALRLIEQIAAYDVGRRIFIVALGGGVVGDLAGFVAAIYKRGVPYVQIPTTLLAQVDSSIGGKTGIDLKCGKNLVGAFHQPQMVVSDAAVLKTLAKRQLINGLAEVIKYGMIADRTLFAYIERNYAALLKGDRQALTHVVARSTAIKARVVASDEKETKGLRTILNFGHTAGHAIEAATRYGQYQHGEAVALGMRVAAEISMALKLLKIADAGRLNQLLDAVGFPQRIQGAQLSKIMDLMRHDKKFVAGKNRFVLAQGIGRVKVVEGIPQEIITAALKKYLA